MRVKNYTDIPNDLITEMIRFARPSGIANFDVRISNFRGTSCRGRAYSSGSGYHDRACPFIIVSVAPSHKFQRANWPARGAYLPTVWGSREEAVLWVLAHELRHLWQATHSRGRVWGSRGTMSERDADAYALHKLRKWRRL